MVRLVYNENQPEFVRYGVGFWNASPVKTDITLTDNR